MKRFSYLLGLVFITWQPSLSGQELLIEDIEVLYDVDLESLREQVEGDPIYTVQLLVKYKGDLSQIEKLEFFADSSERSGEKSVLIENRQIGVDSLKEEVSGNLLRIGKKGSYFLLNVGEVTDLKHYSGKVTLISKGGRRSNEFSFEKSYYIK